jgi:hypothetical protein
VEGLRLGGWVGGLREPLAVTSWSCLADLIGARGGGECGYAADLEQERRVSDSRTDNTINAQAGGAQGLTGGPDLESLRRIVPLTGRGDLL